jgi:16S rRNA (cytosine1402-N4)-methyltransferase
MERTSHVPVMLNEVLEMLQAERGGEFLDCTLGGAGHTIAILKANESNMVTAVDRDSRAIIRAGRKLDEFGPRVKIVHSAFSQIKDALEGKKFDAILLDLGVSTDQLKENRGFSFNDTSPLDMRMDESQELSAYVIVNKTAERELICMLREGGVGREAALAARTIIKARPISKTSELSKAINQALSGKKGKKTNPSTVVFQAIRMAVNDERSEIESILKDAPKMIKACGRLAVISFHSDEDKIVTRTMREWSSQGSYPALWRGVVKEKSLGKLLTKKAVVPSEEEVKKNPASRSARLRVFQFN